MKITTQIQSPSLFHNTRLTLFPHGRYTQVLFSRFRSIPYFHPLNNLCTWDTLSDFVLTLKRNNIFHFVLASPRQNGYSQIHPSYWNRIEEGPLVVENSVSLTYRINHFVRKINKEKGNTPVRKREREIEI